MGLVRIIQSNIGATSSWTPGTVSAGNVAIVAFAGSGSGTASISDNLGTTYTLVNSATAAWSSQYSTVYVWVGVLVASGALTITTTGTFPIQAVDAVGSNAGGQLYFVEAAGVNTTTPVSASLANNGSTSTQAVDSAFSSVAAGSMLLMAAAQGYVDIGTWLSHTGTSFLQQSDLCSAVGVVPVPSTGDYSIGFGLDQGGTCPMSSVALVLNPAATAPSFNMITAVQSAMDTAGSNPWTTGLSVTAGNALVVCQSGTHLGTAAITDNRGTTYVKVGTYSGDHSSAIVMWCGIPATSGALTITQTGTFAVVATGEYNAGGELSVIEFSGVNANGPMMAVSDTWGSTTPTGALASRNAWAQEGAMLVQGAAQGWINVAGWTAVSPATLAQNSYAISALSYSPVVHDNDTIAVDHGGGGPAAAVNLALSPTMVTTGGTTSLFRLSTLSGLGSGGPFFHNPLN